MAARSVVSIVVLLLLQLVMGLRSARRSLNFTFESIPLLNVYGFDAIGKVFGTGDGIRRSMSDFEYLPQNGVKVAMAYGDREYRCNWMGREAVALAAQWEGRRVSVRMDGRSLFRIRLMTVVW
jgi:hypothetical protein